MRYPDKPAVQIGRPGLDRLPGLYIAELKMDGWRCVIEWTAGGVTFTSRHAKPIPISADLAAEIGALGLPVGTMLDAEWLARRPAARDESLWMFDVLQCGAEPLWTLTAAARLARLRSIVPAALIVPTSEADYGDFFDAMVERPDAEGVVLKKRDSRYIGSCRACAENPGWVKAKWRGGEDGRTMLRDCSKSWFAATWSRSAASGKTDVPFSVPTPNRRIERCRTHLARGITG